MQPITGYARPVCDITIFSVAYKVLHRGVVNALCLESLAHGTNPVNNCKIRFFGADPLRGGAFTGSTQGHSKAIDLLPECREYFFAFKDTEFGKNCPLQSGKSRIIAFKTSTWPIAKISLKFFLPKYHTYLSSKNLILYKHVSSVHRGPMQVLRSGFAAGIAGVIAACTPSLSFHFERSEISRYFSNDPDYSGMAYKTRVRLPPWRIGLPGACFVGCNTRLFSRITDNPPRCGVGALQILSVHVLGRGYSDLRKAFLS